MPSESNVMTPAERKALKARAHRLEPVVLIGGEGLSDAVLAEIDRALARHELIKVRAPGLERTEREAALGEICARCGAQAVQHIGKVLVLYREAPPPGSTAASGGAAGGKGPATRSGRRESRSASRRPASAPRPSRRRTSR
jgi:putative YhbY family RNA-binding protein